MDLRTNVTLSVSALEELQESGAPLVLVDVRWVLGDPDGFLHYQQGHLPGAVFGDMNEDLASHASPAEGRHPLPTPAAFQNSVRAWGVNQDSTVVFYDNSGSMAAARGWWLLRVSGFEQAFLLDGGLKAWVAAGLPLETGITTPEPGTVALSPFDEGRIVLIDEAASYPGTLLDARAAERFRGDVEPIDPRAGHIPGALSAPTTENLTPDSLFRQSADLAQRFAGLGVVPGSDVAVYCGSGVTAAHQVAALALAGINARLYPGSFSQWSNDTSREVATGE